MERRRLKVFNQKHVKLKMVRKKVIMQRVTPRKREEKAA